MRIDSIAAENFRLIETARAEFSPEVNIILGDNAQGKTTLLEAVYLLTGMKSFRTRFDKELISFGAEASRIEGKIHAGGRDQKVDILLTRGKRRQVKQNGVKKTGAEVNESLKAVLFSPEDLNIIRGSSAGRRRLMDAAISQLRGGYASLLCDFARLYENKSRILKDWREKPSLLAPLDEFSEGLCRASAKIIRFRASFAQNLNEAAATVHRDFSGNRECLQVRYETISSVDNPWAGEIEIYEKICMRQHQLRQAELDSGLCLVGAHKDDLVFFIDGTEAKTYASQGQVRTAALSVKLAEREIFRKETGENPVLLLDDVLSELDASRQEYVINRLGGGQTLITCCEGGSVSRLTGGNLLRMEKGAVQPCISI